MDDSSIASMEGPRIDPTIVSGPVTSTLVDATGLFIYFSIARIILGL